MNKTRSTPEHCKFPPLTQRYYRLGIIQIFLISLLLGLSGCAQDEEVVNNDALASHKMGLAYLQERQAAKALTEFDKAEKLDPTEPSIKNSLGLAFWAQQKYALAEGKFREAIALDPNYSEVWNNLCALMIDRKRYPEAIEACNVALNDTLYATQELALSNKGWAQYKLGKMSEAKASFELATDLAPGYPLAHLNLGIVLQDMNRDLEALDSFDRTIEIYPSAPRAHLHRGISLHKLGKKEDAQLAFEQAMRLDPKGNIGKSARKYRNNMN